ncbi:hypothetical protein DRQ33_00980 [bacterium]|nr:MAG: hypothetical protein DRQ33_00980 [bacterium]
MNFWKKLEQLDRRIIYVIITLAVILPFFFRLGLPISISPEVKSIYDYIENLSPTDVVFISGDYDPQVDAELTPMLEALVRHCFKKNVKVIAANVYNPQGVGLVEPRLKKLAREYKKVYGVDYVFLGWKYGGTLLIMRMGEDFQGAWEVDYYNTRLEDLPLTSRIQDYDDIALVVSLTGSGAYISWIYYAYVQYGQKLAAGITAVMAADSYPYLQAGQIIGLLGGLRGAAEYEQLIGHPSLGSAGMEAQSWAHIAIIVFIILGNIGYFKIKKK